MNQLSLPFIIKISLRNFNPCKHGYILPVCWNQSSQKKSESPDQSCLRKHPEVFEIPGFRVALAIASLPGMTLKIIQRISDTLHQRCHARILLSEINIKTPIEPDQKTFLA